METYESMSKESVIKLVQAEIKRCHKISISPTSDKVKEYAFSRILECRNMLYWLTTLS